MSYLERLVVCGVISLAGHLLLTLGMRLLPARPDTLPPAIVQVDVTSPPPPEPEPEPEPAKPPEKPPAEEKPPEPLTRRPKTPVQAETHAMVPRDTPPTERPATTGETTGTPVFGVSMESTSEAGSGPEVPIGNTLKTTPDKDKPGNSEPVKPLPAPVAAYEVTKMPLPQGGCTANYTPEAEAAGLEGTVVLDLVVGEDGRPRDITVVQGMDHGLTEAAVAALKGCHFTPGERDGKPVAVRVRGFKIRFLLENR